MQEKKLRPPHLNACLVRCGPVKLFWQSKGQCMEQPFTLSLLPKQQLSFHNAFFTIRFSFFVSEATGSSAGHHEHLRDHQSI
jgi:hypothetical protein